MIDGPPRPRTREQLSSALTALEERPEFGLASEEEVLHLELAAESLGDLELAWRSRLLAAELAGRRGELAQAIGPLHQANEFALAHGHTRLLARSHLVLARTYRDVGDLATSLEHAVRAVELLDAEAPASVRALYLIRLADALDECGGPQEARLRYEQAEEVAVQDGNIVRQSTCLNNRAYGEYLAGDLEDAEATINRLVEVCRRHHAPLTHNTLDTMARIQIALGRYDEAIASVKQAFEAYQAYGVLEAMTPAEFLLTLVAAQRHLGNLEAAQRSLDECRSLAATAGLASVLARVEQEQAELHAARGDFKGAFLGFKAFHAAEKEVISEKRVAQAKLRQALLETNEVRAEAVRLQRLDSYRTQMIATISHELMNPLSTVTGHLEMMSSLTNLPSEALRSMSAIQRGADRLWALTNSLLELTRLEQSAEPPRNEPVNLDDVLTETVDLLEVIAAGEGVSIDHTPAPEPLLVLGNADELHRALVNLVSNAIKYSNRGGTVAVRVEGEYGDVVFTCADDGLGISRDDRKQLFTEFFRSTNQEALGRPGTGLGLAIVQRIAARHRGSVEMTSKLGVGSTFKLRLPAAL